MATECGDNSISSYSWLENADYFRWLVDSAAHRAFQLVLIVIVSVHSLVALLGNDVGQKTSIALCAHTQMFTQYE